jgi:hypothetical protein
MWMGLVDRLLWWTHLDADIHYDTRRAHTTGVSGANGSWFAQISFQRQQRRLGAFDTEEAAARAYDEEAKRLWTNPVLNFLPDGSLNPDRKKFVPSGHMIPRPAAKRRMSSGSSEEEEEEEEEGDEEEDSGSSDEEGAGGGGKLPASIFRGGRMGWVGVLVGRA